MDHTRKTDLPNGFPFLWDAIWMEIKVRSEQLVDGQRYDGEMVIAHLGQERDNREVAFLSILLDASAYEDNYKLNAYISRWEKFAHETEQK